MPRFTAIEGLRAWLAWAVVFSHIGQCVGIDMLGGHWVWFARAGETAVLVFIAISGFVISGLVLDKREPWPRYITRRAFRIFPAYWIAFAAALLTLPLAISAIQSTPWANDPAYGWDNLMRGWAETIRAHTGAQLALHLTLLQGLVPDSVWPMTGTAVLGPAWSLTLEWQFYLVAPTLVWLMLQPRWRFPTVLATVLLASAFHEGVFGQFNLPTFLPGAAFIFIIGIGCRISFEEMKRASIGPEAALLCLFAGLLYADALWLALWLIVYGFLLNAERWNTSLIGRILHWMLQSKPAQYFGARSYSVYLIHLPILQLATWAIVTRMPVTQTQLTLLLILVVTPLVLIASELLYRFVERPMILLGARFAGAARRAAPA